MSIASEIQDLNTNLTAAKDAVTTAGGTVGDTGLAGLASEIGTIPIGGGVSLWGKVWFKPWKLERRVSADNCDVEVDWDAYDAYCETNPISEWSFQVSFQYDSGTELWSSQDFTTPIEGVNATFLAQNLGITVSNVDPEEMGFAMFMITKEEEYIIDTGADSLCLELNESMYTGFGTDMNTSLSAGGHPINLGIMVLPSKAVRRFEFGIEPTSIPDNFLADCSSLESDGVDTSHCSVTTIGNKFLYNAISVNCQLNLSAVTAIGDEFLYYAQAYNQPINLPAIRTIGDSFLFRNTSFNKTLSFGENLTSIGERFLDSCSSFNQPLILPEGLTSIGEGFMCNASKFNQNITMPNSLTSIGSSSTTLSTTYSFFYNANDMCSTIDFQNLRPANITHVSTSRRPYYFSTSSSSVPIYTTGVGIKGAYSSEWTAAFPNRTASPRRKLRIVS